MPGMREYSDGAKAEFRVPVVLASGKKQEQLLS